GVLASFGDSDKRKLRIPPGELPIAEPRVQGDLVAGVFGNVQTIVDRIGCPRRNQTDVNDGASRPRVALVDRVAVGIDQERTIEMSAFLNGTLAVVFYLAA